MVQIDTAIEHGRWRHATRFLRARLDFTTTSTPNPGIRYTSMSRKSATYPTAWWRAHDRATTTTKQERQMGFDYIHAMVDDHSRLAYAGVLPEET